MINLRYHIVSLTAVFLAIGIGLTLGSTFLDRATVENLNGQLEGLENRLDERDTHIQELEDRLAAAEQGQNALDEQATGLLAGELDAVPVVVLAAKGTDEADIDGAIQSLLVAGADVQGQWWLTERFALSSDADVADLAAVLDQDTDDPARLRRTAIATLGRELRIRQEAGAGGTDTGDTGGDAGTSDPSTSTSSTSTTSSTTTTPLDGGGPAPTTTEADSTSQLDQAQPSDLVPVVDALIDVGFIEFEPVPGGADAAVFPDGTRLVLVGGSPDVPDDVVTLPLITRLTLGASEPVPVVVTSAMDGAGDVSDLVSVIRDDERLRTLVPTVDNLEHFQDWAALVLALADLDDLVVGHYGLGEGATRLLPPMRVP